MTVVYTTPYKTTPGSMHQAYTLMGAYFLSTSLHSNERKYISLSLLINTRALSLSHVGTYMYMHPAYTHMHLVKHIITKRSWGIFIHKAMTKEH